jgi:hypothetical protein
VTRKQSIDKSESEANIDSTRINHSISYRHACIVFDNFNNICSAVPFVISVVNVLKVMREAPLKINNSFFFIAKCELWTFGFEKTNYL